MQNRGFPLTTDRPSRQLKPGGSVEILDNAVAEYSGTQYLLPVAAGNFVDIAAPDLPTELVDQTDVYGSILQPVTFLG